MANRPRNPGEDFTAYRLSLATEYLDYKYFRRGRLIHDSTRLGTLDIGANQTKREKRGSSWK
jgi:hypothetical protein